MTTEFSPVEIAVQGDADRAPRRGGRRLRPGAEGAESGRRGGGAPQRRCAHGQPVSPARSGGARASTRCGGRSDPERRGIARRYPVRAVVIDALTLPEPGESEGAQRADPVPSSRRWRTRGVRWCSWRSWRHGAAAWSAFVVDVVFDLAFVPDPETQELQAEAHPVEMPAWAIGSRATRLWDGRRCARCLAGYFPGL